MIKRISAFSLLICFFANIGSFAQSPGKYKSSEIYDFSQQIEKAAKDKIWAGFDFQSYTKAGNDSGGGYLYFSTEPDNKSNETFVWKLSDDYFQNHSLEENLVITFHEAFHAFESDPKRAGRKWGAENAMLVFEYQESSARSNALFSIESRILRAALESKNKSDLKKEVQRFLVIRRLRQSEIEPRFVEFEKGAELNEGLAEYAGTRAVALGMEATRQKLISVPFTAPNIETYLSGKFKNLEAITTVGQNIRRKFYYTGSAQGFLLDRLMPDWKIKVQMEGKSLQELLEASVRKLPSQKEVNALLRKYGYEKILAEEEITVGQRKAKNQALLENTLNQKGRKYVIDYSLLTKPAGVRNFDPINVTMITPKVRIHTRTVSFAGENSFTAIFSQPVVEDLESRKYITVVPENQNESLLVDGVTIDLTRSLETQFYKSLTVNSANFKFEAKTGFVKISGGEINIRLTDN
jgi:hypothetical protein